MPSLTENEVQAQLLRLNVLRFVARSKPECGTQTLQQEMRLRLFEKEYIEAELQTVAAAAARVPRTPQAFVKWFCALEQTGEGQGDALFPWLADRASLAEFRWFLAQEVAGEAGFEDLVALTQLRMPDRVKLELARNYWDEMGQGRQGGMHGPMLHTLATDLGLRLEAPGRGEACGAAPVWEALAVGHTMVAMAAGRQYAYQSLGALGVVELTAPGRADFVNQGLRRLGVHGRTRRYYAVHATLDRKHSSAWNREVIAPLVQSDPELAPLIAQGALLRLRVGARAFARYRKTLWSHPLTQESAHACQ